MQSPDAARRTGPGSGARAAQAALIALMAIGSVVLWIGIPAGWLWVASRMSSGAQATLGPYLLLIFAIPTSMFAFGRLLFGLNAAYERVAGTEPTVRVRLPWHRSMRGEEDSRPPRRVLDVVMVVSVTIAGFVFLVWFLFFAGSSLPGP